MALVHLRRMEWTAQDRKAAGSEGLAAGGGRTDRPERTGESRVHGQAQGGPEVLRGLFTAARIG